MKKLSLLFFPFFVQALASPLSSKEFDFYNQHPDHLSADEFKTLPAEPLFFHPQHKPQTKKRKTLSQHSLSLLKKNISTATELSDNQCYKGFEKTGEELIEHIRSSDTENCLNHLFSKAPKNVRITAFRSQNMMNVAEKTENLTLSYEGQGNDFLEKLFLFLRTGYYNYFYHKEEMDWDETKDAIDHSAVSAIQAFIDHPYFYNVNAEHGSLLWEVLTFTDNAEKQAHFLPTYIDYLKQVDERYNRSNNHSMRSAVNAIFVALFRGHNNRSEFHSAITNNRKLINTLRDFIFSEWVLDSNMTWLASNASLELSRFLQYDGSNIHYPHIAVYNHLLESIRSIINHYRNISAGTTIFISALRNILHYEKCQEYNVCGLDKEIEKQVLNKNYECSLFSGVTVRIRTQNLTDEQLIHNCSLLMEQEIYFHEKLITHQIPVQDDHNSTLEVIVFDTPASYQTYSYLFFGNATNNGGIYLEGDPSNPSNTARFIAYLADWLNDQPVWNLEHEFVHYLDGRFNLYGNFSDYKTQTHKTVWWAEGLAEYISKKNKHSWAGELLQSETHPALSLIFNTNYSNSAELIYPWSYLATRFMFENHFNEVQAFLNDFKQGLYESYKSYIENIGDKYDSEFSEWLNTLEDLKDTRRSQQRIFNQIMHNLEHHKNIDLMRYLEIPENAEEISANSSHSEIVTALIIDRSNLIITPHSLGSATISITITTEDNRKLIYTGQITVIQGFRFIPDETLSANGTTYKYIKPSSLSICKKTKTINLLHYTESPLPEEVSFEISVNYSEDTATAEIDGSLLTVTALKVGETQIWINLLNEGWPVDEILLQIPITGDPEQCEEEEEEDDDDDDDELKCTIIKIGNIWIPICS